MAMMPSAPSAFAVPRILSVFVGDQFCNALPFAGSPLSGHKLPSRLLGKLLHHGVAHLRRRQPPPREFLNAGQGGRVRATRQQDRSVLQQGTALPALRAADDFGISNQEIAGRQVLEAKYARREACSAASDRTSADAEATQRSG